MKWYYAGLALLATLSFCYAFLEVGTLAKETRTWNASALIVPTQKMLGNVTGLAYNASQVVGQERKAFAAQQQYFNTTATETSALFSELTDVARSVNNATIPKINNSIDNASSVIHGIGSDFDSVSNTANQEMEELSPSLKLFNLDLAELRPSLDHFNATMAHVDNVSGEVDQEGALVVSATRKAMAPKNKFLSVVEGLGGGTVKVTEFLYYLSIIH